MFRCGCCQQLSTPGETATRVVTQTRPMSYSDETGTVSRGIETVVEVLAHETCAYARLVEALPPNRKMRRMTTFSTLRGGRTRSQPDDAD